MTGKALNKAERERKALEALLICPTVKEAAEQSGLSESTLYRYLGKDEFKEAYRKTKKEIMRTTSNQIQLTALIAIETLKEIMQDKKAVGMARVTAAKTVLDLSYQTHRDEDIYTELEELRELVEAIKGSGFK